MIRGLYNKDSLIKYNELLDRKEMYSAYDNEAGPAWNLLSDAEIYRKCENATDDIILVFGDLLKHLHDNNTKVNDLSLGLSFSVFVDDDSITEEGELKDSPKVLSDYVEVVIDNVSGHTTNNQEFSVDTLSGPESLYDRSLFVTRFSDFVIGLNKAGFTLDGLDSFGDVKEKVLSGEKASGTINLGMEKESVKEYRKSDR